MLYYRLTTPTNKSIDMYEVPNPIWHKNKIKIRVVKTQYKTMRIFYTNGHLIGLPPYNYYVYRLYSNTHRGSVGRARLPIIRTLLND